MLALGNKSLYSFNLTNKTVYNENNIYDLNKSVL